MSPRNQKIVAARAEGRTFQSIAQEHGISRQRVQQIIKAREPRRKALKQSRTLLLNLALREAQQRVAYQFQLRRKTQ